MRESKPFDAIFMDAGITEFPADFLRKQRGYKGVIVVVQGSEATTTATATAAGVGGKTAAGHVSDLVLVKPLNKAKIEALLAGEVACLR